MVDALLSCAHPRRVNKAVQIGDAVYCYRCSDESIVVSDTDSYRVKCKDCKFHRDYANHEPNAYRGIKVHLLRYPMHRVDLYKGRKRIKTVKTLQVELPLYKDPSGVDDRHTVG